MSCEDISCAISVVELTASLEDTGIAAWGSITGDVDSQTDLTNYVFDHVIIDTTYEETGSEAVGTAFWNSDDEVLSVKVTENVTTDLSQEVQFPVINQTGGDISDGTPVMFAGTLGNSGKIKIQKAIADGTLDSFYMMGVATETIANGSSGKVTHFGKVRGIDTTGTPFSETWEDGDILYVSPATAGYLTKTKPDAPNLQIIAAVVVKAHSNGTLFVRPTWHCKIQDLDDFDGGVLDTTGQLIVWDNGNGYFEPTQNVTITDSTRTINSDDDLNISCGTNKTLELQETVWEDIQFPVDTGKVPASNAPSFETFTTNTKAFAFDVNDNIDLQSNEVPHSWAEGTDASVHAHVAIKTAQSTGASQWVKVEVDIAYAKVTGVFTEQTFYGEIEIPDGSSALQHFLISMDTLLDLSGMEIGTQIKPKLTRISATSGDEYSDSVFILQVGAHVENNTLGSREIASK